MEVEYARPEKTSIALRHAAKIHRKMSDLVLNEGPESVLEVGCGSGVLGSLIAARGVTYVGLDPDDVSLSQSKSQFPDLRVVKGDCYDDPASLRLGIFDLVCSNDVIEHVYSPRKYMQFVGAHLQPGGTFVCGTPNYGNYTRNLLLAIFNRWDHQHNPLWDGGHIKFFSMRTLGKLLDECDFKVEQRHSLGSSRVPFASSAIFCVATRR